MIFYPNRSFCFEKYFIFSWTQLPRNAKAILAKFWVTSKNVKLVSCLRFYNALRRSGKQKSSLKLSKILEQPPICNPKSSLKLSNSHVQSLPYSVCTNFYISSKLPSCVIQPLRNFSHFNVNLCIIQNIRKFHISMFPGPSFPC